MSAAWLDAVTVLRRSRTGDCYHRADCRHLGKLSLPWLWAEGKTRADLDDAKANGLKPCGHCDPDGALPEGGAS